MKREIAIGDHRSLAEQLATAHSVDALATLYGQFYADWVRGGAKPNSELRDALYPRLFELEETTPATYESKAAEILENFFRLMRQAIERSGVTQEMKDEFVKNLRKTDKNPE